MYVGGQHILASQEQITWGLKSIFGPNDLFQLFARNDYTSTFTRDGKLIITADKHGADLIPPAQIKNPVHTAPAWRPNSNQNAITADIMKTGLVSQIKIRA
jgi:hypothetical protein